VSGYEDDVQKMAEALHEDCTLEWQAWAILDPTRQITMHHAAAHYGKAHDLVRRFVGDPIRGPYPPQSDSHAERARHAALVEAVEALPVHYRRNGFASATAWVTRRDVLRILRAALIEEARKP
jgi:hypothetical protein